MNQLITYGELSALEQDIRRQQQISPAFVIFNKEKIRRFYQQNNLRLKILQDTIKDLVSKHVLHDEKDKPVTQEVEGQLRYKFIDEGAQKEYEEKVTAFFALNIELHL